MTLAAIDQLDPSELKRLLDSGRVLLIDVREPAEYASERIPGALLYPLSTFNADLLPADDSRQVVFHCGSGKRSLTAAEHRIAAGHRRAAHLRGGLQAWKQAGLPVIALR
jgi:rhodanese-related sulfurtransferase